MSLEKTSKQFEKKSNEKKKSIDMKSTKHVVVE